VHHLFSRCITYKGGWYNFWKILAIKFVLRMAYDIKDNQQETKDIDPNDLCLTSIFSYRGTTTNKSLR